MTEETPTIDLSKDQIGEISVDIAKRRRLDALRDEFRAISEKKRVLALEILELEMNL